MKKNISLLASLLAVAITASAEVPSGELVEFTPAKVTGTPTRLGKTALGKYKGAQPFLASTITFHPGQSNQVIYTGHPEYIGYEIVGVKVTDQPTSGVANYKGFVLNNSTEATKKQAPQKDSEVLAEADMTMTGGTGVAYFDDPIEFTASSYLSVGYSFDVTDHTNDNAQYPLYHAPKGNCGGFFSVDSVTNGAFWQYYTALQSETEEYALPITIILRNKSGQPLPEPTPEPTPEPSQEGKTFSVVDFTQTPQWFGNATTQSTPGMRYVAMGVYVKDPWSGATINPELSGKQIIGARISKQLTADVSNFSIFILNNDKVNGGTYDYKHNPDKKLNYIEDIPVTMNNGEGTVEFANPITLGDADCYYVGYKFRVDNITPTTMNPFCMLPCPSSSRASYFKVEGFNMGATDNFYGFATSGTWSDGLESGAPITIILDRDALTDILPMNEDAQDTVVTYYDLQGRQVMNPQHGLFIKKVGNKTTKVIK